MAKSKKVELEYRILRNVESGIEHTEQSPVGWEVPEGYEYVGKGEAPVLETQEIELPEEFEMISEVQGIEDALTPQSLLIEEED